MMNLDNHITIFINHIKLLTNNKDSKNNKKILIFFIIGVIIFLFV